MIQTMFKATRVRDIRVGKLMSQAQLAERANITIATLSRLERGHQRPHFITLAKLAKALHVKPTDLIDRADGGDAAAD
jgi:transcriptional regulator with XRE-family HTH domain